jgi:uncharacterized protein (TIGR02231 family)
MRKVFGVVLGWAVLLAAVPAWAGDILAASTIKKVTVYQDRALVTRTAKVELEAGDNTVLFESLPGALLEDSLRADGKGQKPVTIYGAEVKKAFGTEEADPRIAKVAAELEKLRYELKSLQGKYQALVDQKAFLDSVRNFSSVQIPKDIMTKSSSPSDWAGISKFLYDAYLTNSADLLEAEKAVAEKNREVEAKQREYYDIQAGLGIEKKSVVVSVNAKEKTFFDVELSYVVPQAMWVISYDAKAYPAQGEFSLVSYGNIRQWTGEDWTDVRVSLSTAKPSIGGRMPELDPWFVDFPQPVTPYPKQAVRAMMAMAPEASMDQASVAYDSYGGGGSYEAKAELAQSQVRQELGSVNYDLPRAFTVKSDNRFYKSPVETREFAVETDYEATPKLSPYAFIHAKVTNNTDHLLAGGEISIFLNDQFVGKSSIETVGQNEKFDLYLGIDEEIKVKRTELVDKKKKALLGLKSRKDFAYKIELENYKKESIKIAVYDQVPVSKNGDIKAELESSSIKPSETKDLGILKWDFELKPAEKKALEFAFFVEHPADKVITGA